MIGPGVPGRRCWITPTDMRRNTLRYCALRGLHSHDVIKNGNAMILQTPSFYYRLNDAYKYII